MTIIAMPFSALTDAIVRCNASMSSEETRYYLQGIHMRKTDTGVLFESTDGHRLTQARVNIAGVADFKSIIIPKHKIAEIKKLGTRRNGRLTASFDLTDVPTLSIGDIHSAPLAPIEYEFPDTGRVIPQSVDYKLVLDRKTFMECLAPIAGFAKGADHCAVKLSICKGELAIEARSDRGSARTSMPFEVNSFAEGFAVGFNAQYLTDFVKHIESRHFSIAANDPGSPTLLNGAFDVDAHETFVLMPMRV